MDFTCAPFGKLAVIPLTFFCLFKYGVVGVMRLPLAPNSAIVEFVVGADTKILFILCRLLVE